jgi:hypothetical protein
MVLSNSSICSTTQHRTAPESCLTSLSLVRLRICQSICAMYAVKEMWMSYVSKQDVAYGSYLPCELGRTPAVLVGSRLALSCEIWGLVIGTPSSLVRCFDAIVAQHACPLSLVESPLCQSTWAML